MIWSPSITVRGVSGSTPSIPNSMSESRNEGEREGGSEGRGREGGNGEEEGREGMEGTEWGNEGEEKREREWKGGGEGGR